VPKRIVKNVLKHGLTPLRLEHVLLLILGVSILVFTRDVYENAHPVVQVIILIAYLGSLVGIAPIPLPVFKRKFWQIVFTGLLSGVLDSYIVLEQSKKLRTVEAGQSEEEVARQTENQHTEGERAKLLVLMTLAALIGGLIIWFGEVYAAGLFLHDGRTSILSALYILPPVLVFLAILGFHAEKLSVDVVRNKSIKSSWIQFAEFASGIMLLLVTDNPLFAIGILMVYAVLTRQDDELFSVWRHNTEISVMLVLLLALVAGGWLVSSVIEPIGLGQGAYLPIIPAGVQAVLWGPLYTDSTVHFWIRIATLSTGALLLPISSLVGVMLFKTKKQWLLYMRYSFMYSAIWYGLFRVYIWLTLETQVGTFLEQWASSAIKGG